MRLVDTDVLVDILRGHPSGIAWFASLDALPAVPGLVVMELLAGCSDEREARRVDTLVGPLPLIWPTEADCLRALATFRARRLSHGLGLLGALVAACAVGADATLYSFNAKHYAAVADLAIEQPYSR